MRVLSKHEAVHVCVEDQHYFVEFTEEQPGVFAAEVDDEVGLHLLQRIGEAGGFWTDWVEDAVPQDAVPQESDEEAESEASGQPEQLSEDHNTEAVIAKPRRKRA